MARRTKPRPLPDGWSETDHLTVNGRHVTTGTELSVWGRRGRVRFVKQVTSPKSTWLQCWAGQRWAFIDPNAVKTVHYARRKLR